MSDHIILLNTIASQHLSKSVAAITSLGIKSWSLQGNGIKIPDGFIISETAYQEFLNYNYIEGSIRTLLQQLDHPHYSNLNLVGKQIRQLILDSDIPYGTQISILSAFNKLRDRSIGEFKVHVKCSVREGVLSEICCSGQAENHLNLTEDDDLLNACLACYASLFNDEAIKYRAANKIDHFKTGPSIAVLISDETL